jgi:hypothetical protein
MSLDALSLSERESIFYPPLLWSCKNEGVPENSSEFARNLVWTPPIKEGYEQLRLVLVKVGCNDKK